MKETRKNRPETCEFTPEIKLEALRRANWCCERCGKHKSQVKGGYLEIHHRLGIAIALHHHPEISHALLSSVANARCYCQPCHDIMDREDRKKHWQLARELLSFQVRQLQLELASS